MGVIFDNLNYVLNLIWIPAIIISAILSVLMSDFHREIKGTINWFNGKIQEDIDRFLNRSMEIIISLFLALIMVFIIIFIGILLKLLIDELIHILP